MTDKERLVNYLIDKYCIDTNQANDIATEVEKAWYDWLNNKTEYDAPDDIHSDAYDQYDWYGCHI